MSIVRQMNFLSQMRLDVPHFRAFESSIVADFDLTGRVLTGGSGYVVKGLTVPFDGPVPAEQLTLHASGALVLHPGASEKGTYFEFPTAAPEALSPKFNPRIIGAFQSGSFNYIGIDFRRILNTSTSDTVKFYDPDTKGETSKVVPLARTVEYRIIVSTQPFSYSSNILPIAIVRTDSANNAIEVQDARRLFCGLWPGGDNPGVPRPLAWKDRFTSPKSFNSGDKDISSLKGWMDAVMHRLWELGGGEGWYAPTTDRDVKVAYGPSTLTSGNNFTYTVGNDGTVTLYWSGISILFGNSTATVNVVSELPNNITFPDGHCLYVNIKRDEEGAVLSPVVVPFDSKLGTPEIPGSRIVLAWRKDAGGTVRIYTRDREYEIGRGADLADPGGRIAGIMYCYKPGLTSPPIGPKALTTDSLNVDQGVPSLTVRPIGSGANSGLFLEGPVMGTTGEWNPSTHGTHDLGTHDYQRYWRNLYLTGQAYMSRLTVGGGAYTPGPGSVYIGDVASGGVALNIGSSNAGTLLRARTPTGSNTSLVLQGTSRINFTGDPKPTSDVGDPTDTIGAAFRFRTSRALTTGEYLFTIQESNTEVFSIKYINGVTSTVLSTPVQIDKAVQVNGTLQVSAAPTTTNTIAGSILRVRNSQALVSTEYLFAIQDLNTEIFAIKRVNNAVRGVFSSPVSITTPTNTGITLDALTITNNSSMGSGIMINSTNGGAGIDCTTTGSTAIVAKSNYTILNAESTGTSTAIIAKSAGPVFNGETTGYNQVAVSVKSVNGACIGATSKDGPTISATSDGGIAITGYSKDNVGVSAKSDTSIGLTVQNGSATVAPMRIITKTTQPTSGLVGDMVMDDRGRLWIYTGNTWRRLALDASATWNT